MGICDKDNPKKKRRKRKTSFSTGRNAGDRVRGKPFRVRQQIDWEVTQPDDMVSIPSSETLLDVTDYSEEMYDTHGYIQRWYNPCVHVRFRNNHRELPPIEDADGVVLDFKSTSPSLYEGISATLPFLSPAQIDDLVARSEYKLSTVLEQSTSIINFLLECITVIGGIIKAIERFSKLYEAIMKTFKEAYMRFRKQGHKETAAYWLAWNFAIKPAIADLKAIICSIHDAQEKLEWLRRNNDRIIHLTYERDLTDQLPLSNEWLNARLVCSVLKADPPSSTANGGYWQQVQYPPGATKLKYVARSKVHLTVPRVYLDGPNAVATLWSVLMGITNPTFIVWEAIPFSWLIDYFLTFRARLWQKVYSWNPYNEGVKVLEYGHSFSYHVIGFGRLRVRKGTDEHTHHDYGVFELRAYVRDTGLPHGGQATYFAWGMNPYRFSLVGAIIVGGIRHRRR